MFSETCGTSYHFALELSSSAGEIRVLAHSNDKVSSVRSPNLLATIGGFDLYSVRTQCAASGGQFWIDVRQENGRVAEQVITIHDDGSAFVGKSYTVKGDRRSS